jgi:hypothetical protein
MARTRKSASVLFDAITIEGNLITPAMLSRIAAHETVGQSEADYSIPRGLTLRDEIARYFRIGQAIFQDLFSSPAPSTAATVNFTEALLRDVFGFSDLNRVGHREQDGRTFPVTLEGASGRVPVVVVPPADDLDRPSTHLQGEGRRRSAASALQEWLNASEPALWGLCCNGNALRLIRDNASLTRPAYIEANLRQIFEAESFADFAALWLLVHVSRFGKASATPADSALERWREAGNKEGEAARERLSIGVHYALLSLGNGFLAHPDNAALRERLASNQLALSDFFGQLLRLVYRLIFLLAAEDRGLLHAPDIPVSLRKLYAQGYSLGALRDAAIRRSCWDRYHDRWEGLLITFAALAEGEPSLGLPALGGIFDHNVISDLESLRLSNRSLMEAIYRLAWLKDAILVPVNWRDMETEELGSVYEGLLELTPRLGSDGRSFSFAEGAETKGNERKTSGSYYTPDSLVQALLDSALDPVLDRIESESEDTAEGLLGVTVIDPACGSGHFLLAAARRIATRVAHARCGGVASAEDYRHALRDVARNCIYGVDRNPMAVELTKVALWIETVEPGKPLGFLDANIRCGDSLLGVYNLEVLRDGIPDAAYKPLTGDDKAIARDFARINREQREGQGYLFGGRHGLPAAPPLAEAARRLHSLPEDTTAQIAEKRRSFQTLSTKVQNYRWRQAADAYIAAFLTPKTRQQVPETAASATIPTTEDVYNLISGTTVYGPRVGHIQQLVAIARPFHWQLEFPDIFDRGGFDVVLGNPPWERIKIQEQEFFASREPEIAEAPNAAARGRMIAALREAAEGTRERALFDEFEYAKRIAEASSVFARLATEEQGRFPLTGRGDVNTYALFAELFATLPSKRGRAGVIVPMGIATDATTSLFFGSMIIGKRLASLLSFENEEFIFPSVHHAFRFSLLTLANERVSAAKFSFFLRQTSQLSDPRRRFQLSPEEIERINPNTKTAPIFRTRTDAELTAKIYSHVPILWDENKGESGNLWGISFMRMFDMANDSGIFHTSDDLRALGCTNEGTEWRGQNNEIYVPLYEAKLIHQFTHRWATYNGIEVRDISEEECRNSDMEVLPRYWIDNDAVNKRLLTKNWEKSWLIGWREITGVEKIRTLISSIVPAGGWGARFLLLFPDSSALLIAALYGSLNSIVCDYCARQKVGGIGFGYFTLKQIPVLPPSTYSEAALEFIVPRVLELTYTSHSMAPFARDLGYDGPPFCWDEDRRAQLRAELDAWYARAYGLTRDELRYILDPADVMGEDYPSETFRVLKKNELKKYKEFRTQKLVLAAWDNLAQIEAAPPTIMAVPATIPTTELPDDAWRMPDFNVDSVTAQLAAILKKLQEPTQTEKVRLAAIYALYPQYLTPLLKGNKRSEWQRLTGTRSTAAANVISFSPKISVEWNAAYTQLRGMRVLLEDGPNNTWAAGLEVHGYYTESWPDGRAGFVMEALEEIGVDSATTALPANVLAWVKEYAA